MIPLSTFPPALLRLILCGGGGLPPAWGPLHHVGTHEEDVYPWDPITQRASGLPGYLYDDGRRIERWSLPLDPSSPWPARLAMVAAWMLTGEVLTGASIERSDPKFFRSITIMGWRRTRDGERGWGREYRWNWNPETGDDHDAVLKSSHLWLTLPTLPTHLATHPPEVALPLALHDLSEVAARVAAAVTP